MHDLVCKSAPLGYLSVSSVLFCSVSIRRFGEGIDVCICLGAFEVCSELYDALEIKSMQIDTLG